MSDPGSEYSTYEYMVDGTKYTGSSDTGYDVGRKITVYYDPTDPAVSADSQGELELYGCISFIFGPVAVGGIVWNLIKLRKAAE